MICYIGKMGIEPMAPRQFKCTPLYQLSYFPTVHFISAKTMWRMHTFKKSPMLSFTHKWNCSISPASCFAINFHLIAGVKWHDLCRLTIPKASVRTRTENMRSTKPLFFQLNYRSRCPRRPSKTAQQFVTISVSGKRIPCVSGSITGLRSFKALLLSIFAHP